MSIRTDIWIDRMCKANPLYVDLAGHQVVEYLQPPYSLRENHFIDDLHRREAAIAEGATVTIASHGRHVERATNFEPMITPYVDMPTREVDGQPVLSFGLSSMGYDVRLAKGLKVFTDIYSPIIDPKGLDTKAFIDVDDDVVIIPPNGFALGHTVETFNIPRDVAVICMGKSTYARAGVAINITPIEPGFKGQVVIEIANCTNSPVKIYTGEGIAQFMFFQSDRNCRVSYADKNGKYQGQSGIQLPLV